jgi:hypothetical protein
MIKPLLTFIILLSCSTAFAQIKNGGDACHDFDSFFKEFRTNEKFRNSKIKYPLPYINIAVCDDFGHPKINPDQNEKYPKNWCKKFTYSKEEFREFGPDLIFPLTFLQTKEINPNSIKNINGTKVYFHDLDDCSLNPADEQCDKKWQKYYFELSENKCWMLVKAELFMHVPFGEH